MVRAFGPARPDEEEYVATVSACWPDRWRLDGRWSEQGPTLTVVDGPSWMAWSPEQGARANFGDRHHGHGNPARELLTPAPLFGSDILDLRSAEVDGRPCWRMTAQARDRHRSPRVAWPSEHGIDDYDAHVDRETGLAVRLVGRVDGEDALRQGFDRIQFGVDAPHDERAFSLVPPDSTAPVDVT